MTERATTHDELQTDLAAYALGTLDPAARDALEAHLADCDECQALLAEYEAVVDLYPLATPDQQPPDGALDRLLDRARSASNPVELPRQADRRPVYLWAGVAAIAALLLVMVAWNLWLQSDSGSDYSLASGEVSWVVPLAGSENAENASAHLVMDEEWENGALIASGLPALSAERDYQLWFVRDDGTRESGGVFHPAGAGQIAIRVDIPDTLAGIELIGVTEEPAGGSSGPTGRNVLLGEFVVGS